MSNSSSSSSSSLSSPINVGDWFIDDSYSNFMNQYIQLQRQQLDDDASSSKIKKKKRRYIERSREDGAECLYKDYFDERPNYNEDILRRRYRMRRPLFIHIHDAVTMFDPYFQSKRDCIGRQSLSSIQKCTAAMRMLAYGVAADAVDEYLRIVETTTIQCVKRFVKAVIAVFGDEYMRRPNLEDLQQLLHSGEQRGFPGMLGSIDCMHWEWKNCPVAWHGQYTRGTLNDINVLDRYLVFNEVLEGREPKVNFQVNGNNYNLGYYLTDGIYPNWATFVKSIPLPQGPKHALFAKRQEAARKDVERAFGVLQARFSIISGPSRMWCKEIIGEIMRACVIMHNMIVEDERDSYIRQFDYTYNDVTFNISMPEISRSHLPAYDMYLRTHAKIRNRSINHRLQADLVEEIWNRFRDEENDD